LFRKLVSAWTEFGPIYALSGPDIFLKTMDSKTFIAYLHDDLQSAFISTPEEVRESLEKLEDKSTIDGRYRIEEFRCMGRVWQGVFEALLERCDAAILDLRGFEKSHGGTAFELFTVVKGSHQAKVMFVADETTNKNDLRDVVAAASEACTAPHGRDGTIKITDVTGSGMHLTQRLLPVIGERVSPLMSPSP